MELNRLDEYFGGEVQDGAFATANGPVVFVKSDISLRASARMRFNGERSGRWIVVEALCLCATLERINGSVSPADILSSDADPRVMKEALRLTSRFRPQEG
jgi:hypothetical protein